jgi:hypothetical protein
MTMTYTRTIQLGDDIIDPRDIVERVKELEEELAEALESWEDDEDEFDAYYAEEIKERKQWTTLLSDISDPEDGEALILDSYFQEYARDLASDLGMMDDVIRWPFTCIDWEWAARELKHDYSAVEIDGYTYWQRA